MSNYWDHTNYWWGDAMNHGEQDRWGRVGDRVRAIHFGPSEVINDNVTVPMGTEGRITYIDDWGTRHVDWDNGRHLGLLPNVDSWVVVKQAKISGPEVAWLLTQWGDTLHFPVEKAPHEFRALCGVNPPLDRLRTDHMNRMAYFSPRCKNCIRILRSRGELA